MNVIESGKHKKRDEIFSNNFLLYFPEREVIIKETMKNQNTEIITPIKKKKKQEFRDAADEIYNTAVSRIRQWMLITRKGK